MDITCEIAEKPCVVTYNTGARKVPTDIKAECRFCKVVIGPENQKERKSELINERNFFNYFPILCPDTNGLLLLTYDEKMRFFGNMSLNHNVNKLEEFRTLILTKRACKMLVSDGSDNFNRILGKINYQIGIVKQGFVVCNQR